MLQGRGGTGGRSTERVKPFVLSSQALTQGTEASAGAVHIPATLVTESRHLPDFSAGDAGFPFVLNIRNKINKSTFTLPQKKCW